MVIEEVDDDGNVHQRGLTLDETLKKALDDERYNPIHVILSKLNERLLSEYSFTPLS